MTKASAELHTPLAVIPDDNGDHRAIAKQCLENIEANWFVFSKVVYRIYKDEEYKAWGYSNFKDYVEAELVFKYKSAMYRVAMGEAIEMFDLTSDDVRDLGGWTKFGFLTPAINKDMKRKDFLALLHKAKDMSAREVKDYVETLVTETQDVTKRATMTFLFTNESIGVVRGALDTAKGLADTESDAVALEYITLEWMMNHNPKKAEEIQTKLAPPPPKIEKTRKERSDVKKRAAKKENKTEAKETAKPKRSSNKTK